MTEQESYDEERVSDEFREEHHIEKGRKVIGYVEILMTEKNGIPRISFNGGRFFKHEYEKHLETPIVKKIH
ncbi:hypothetical protein [Nitrosopumilus piranensis]|uniref:Uncharacterized protein n=1 Tax=Nitrosopumilus piranensis TaxID=1582439 RepID=A0A0C5BQY2_9ARCH|nr:hypothetical protein [Nitrosopumilus piranensis]AJM92163.1 hypothetical protein NPIRD3C_0951 [Nitrosopumilus piranensis]